MPDSAPQPAERRHGPNAGKQAWRCDACFNGGTVDFDPEAGVYEVRNLIADDHARFAPRCSESKGLTFVRVLP